MFLANFAGAAGTQRSSAAADPYDGRQGTHYFLPCRLVRWTAPRKVDTWALLKAPARPRLGRAMANGCISLRIPAESITSGGSGFPMAIRDSSPPAHRGGGHCHGVGRPYIISRSEGQIGNFS